MKRHFNLILLAILTGLLALGACSNDAWDELPSPITNFISHYFPGSGVKSYSEHDGVYNVQVNNGASMTFDSEYQWTEIDGNGSKLPEVMMYDQLPPALFSYLQGTEQQDGVYGMKRDKKVYKLTMLDTVLTYNIQTGAVTYPGQSSD